MRIDVNKTLVKLLVSNPSFLPFKAFIKRRANGHLPYDYLVPAGPYQEQRDWMWNLSVQIDILMI